MRVGVIDYGAGNTFSILSGLRRAKMGASMLTDPDDVRSNDALVIPGVGHFSKAVRELDPYRDVIREFADEGRPVLGICLGMQVLLDSSKEGDGDGLGLISGTVERFSPDMKTPHMGWNSVSVRDDCLLFDGLPEHPYFYFVHSYYVVPEDDSTVVSTTDYEVEFASAIARDSLFGLQFHPEKSGEHGAIVLDNFREIIVR